jgi:putative CocE/NonD family hydrolase
MPPVLDLLLRTPLTDVTELDGSAGAHYAQWLAHPARDEFWEPVSYDNRYHSVTTPALHVAGWYDVFLGGTIANYLALSAQADGAEARAGQQLVIGPWTHMNQTGRFDGRSYGAAGMAPAGIHDLQFDHFDRWLTGRAVVPIENPVHIFVMGIDQWRSAPSWPLPDTHYTPLYLHAATRPEQSGGLAFEPAPAGTAPSRYTYDPIDPVPTLGGPTLIGYLSSEGPVDQRPNDDRDDVLSFVSSPLAEQLEVTGPVTMVAFVSASTTDTDLTATLIDVHPDGRAELLTDGILRLRYRNSTSSPEPLDPGTVYEVHIDMWATSNVFGPGHRIRIDLSSSNFPRYDRNSNTGGVIARERLDEMAPTTVTVQHDSEYPSHVRLPVIHHL